MATEFYLNTATGRADAPCYDRWYRWTKYGLNTASVILGIGVLVFGEGEPAGHEGADGLFIFLVLLRLLEVAGDTIPLIRRRKDPTMPQGGNVTVLWFTRCCERREGAERVDQVLKYCSSCGLSLLLCILSFYICSVQASIGTALLGLLTLADVFVGGYVVILDECVKERRRVRTKPYQLDLDDALALTDDDALAKDMFARPSANGPQSYYMQAVPHVSLHELKVEGQWNRPGIEEDKKGPLSSSYREPAKR